ncbi:acetyltransferase [Penicillium antarcticum]|uniref:acetyltransferase n=1 Tax=Penicillium antarcticum TaxID=416450 RepID=UPI0023860535|nr:acetyltransferase [Penicillium antarcticum]KAJ5309210.1 acetyltransferase [Penicillium antarcticum]
MTVPNTLYYRKAMAADVAAVLKLIRSAFRGEESRAGWTTEADLIADDRIDQESLLGKIERSDGMVLLAHDHAGKLAACCEISRQDGQDGYLGLLAVDPLRQISGIGKKLLTEAEVIAKEKLGASKLEIRVIWTRDSLIEWYTRRGYSNTGRAEPFPYDQLVNGKALRDDLYFIIMKKELESSAL